MLTYAAAALLRCHATLLDAATPFAIAFHAMFFTCFFATYVVYKSMRYSCFFADKRYAMPRH